MGYGIKNDGLRMSYGPKRRRRRRGGGGGE